MTWTRAVFTTATRRFLPAAAGLKRSRHLAGVVLHVLLVRGRGDLQLPKQLHQPGEASEAAEGWETSAGLQSAT